MKKLYLIGILLLAIFTVKAQNIPVVFAGTILDSSATGIPNIDVEIAILLSPIWTPFTVVPTDSNGKIGFSAAISDSIATFRFRVIDCLGDSIFSTEVFNASISDSVITSITICRNATPNCSVNFSSSFLSNYDMEFTASVIPQPSASAHYIWDFGDGNTVGPLNNLNNVIHTFPDTGTYNVCLTYNDSSANCQDVKCDSIYIPFLGCNVSFSSQNFGSAFSFSGNTTLSSQGLSYVWDFGDGNVSSGKNVAHAYEDPGLYNVCLQVQNSTSQCTTCNSVLVDFDSTLLQISGNVGINSANTSGDMVILYAANNKGSAPFIRAVDTTILVNGNYTFHGLNSASYSIRVIPENQSMNSGLMPRYWQAANYWGDANSLLLSASQQGINMIFDNNPFAISGQGSIVVSVRDSLDQYVSGAIVWLEDMKQDVLRYAISSNGSEVIFDNLPLGNYKVGTDYPGYYMFREDVSLSNTAPRDSIGLKILGNWLTTPIRNSATDNKIYVYPNPAEDHFFIKNFLLNPIISIFDLQGREVTFNASKLDDGLKIVFCEKLNSGIYMIKMKTNEYSLIKKLIVK